MRSRITLRGALFAAAIGAALSFGTAAAADAPPPPCSSPFAEGSCRTLSDCQQLCASRGFDPSASVCSDRCCFCNAI